MRKNAMINSMAKISQSVLATSLVVGCAFADHSKQITLWIDVEDAVLRPGEATKVTVWAKLNPGPGTPVAFFISSLNQWFPGSVQGFGYIAVWDLLNMSGVQAGSFGLPAMHNPAFFIDQGKGGTFAGGSVLTLSSYNYCAGLLYNPNAIPDNPIWLYSATFTPKEYSAKTIELRVQASGANVGVFIPTWPPWPPNPNKNATQWWALKLVPGYVTVLPESCQADCDFDNNLTIDDFICFQTLFAIGNPEADCDGDSQLLIDDFICFQTLYAIGC